MIHDKLLDKLGDFYTSDYVAKNQPWVIQTPFHEWVDRHLAKREGGGQFDQGAEGQEQI